MNFDDVIIVEDEYKQILGEVAQTDIRCATTLRNIGDDIIVLAKHIRSFQNKYGVIETDKTINSNEKLKQKNILLSAFLNDDSVYNNIRKITDKILTLKFSDVVCVSKNTKDSVCGKSTNDIEFDKFNSALIKYKTVLRDLLRWTINMLNERQTYCGFNSVNEREIRQLYNTTISVLDPYYNYYIYLYGGLGIAIGIFIGMVFMYYTMKK